MLTSNPELALIAFALLLLTVYGLAVLYVNKDRPVVECDCKPCDCCYDDDDLDEDESEEDEEETK